VLSGIIAWFDRHVVDGLMNGFAWASQVGGSGLKKVQSGQVQTYAFVFFLGLAALMILAMYLNPALLP
jgi:NADH-quinone oxidoreductase subunit L